MSDCLGLYIENNLIKYAKISKEKENIKVEAFGMKFFDDLGKTIEQIIRETYSYKTPISANISNEKYTTSNLFSLLNKSDLIKAIGTEFEYFCNENTKNINAIEYRYLTTPNIEDKDKIRILYTYVEKANIVEKLQTLDEYKVSTLVPVAISVANLTKGQGSGNSIIVNLESKTTITILSEGKPYKVETFDEGMENIIKDIAERENSFSKAYEICKNTTIYTRAGQNLQLEENDYLDQIMPTLYNIIEKTEDVIKKSEIEIDNIYITGTGAVINNIDLYFQENFMNKKCEILVPFFIEKANLKLNIKDYVEVNSAIAIGLEGLKTKVEEPMNFSNKGAIYEKVKDVLSMEIGKTKGSTKKPSAKRFSLKEKFNYNLKASLDWTETLLLRGCATVLIALIIYTGATMYLSRNINLKTKEAEEVIIDTQTKTDNVKEYASLVNKKTSEYNSLIDKIEQRENEQIEKMSRKNAIPNMLNQVMFAVPNEVQIILIENTVDRTIKIIAEAEEYQQLGYFKAAIQDDTILTNVTSTSGTYVNGLIRVEITGELPY